MDDLLSMLADIMLSEESALLAVAAVLVAAVLAASRRPRACARPGIHAHLLPTVSAPEEAARKFQPQQPAGGSLQRPGFGTTAAGSSLRRAPTAIRVETDTAAAAATASKEEDMWSIGSLLKGLAKPGSGGGLSSSAMAGQTGPMAGLADLRDSLPDCPDTIWGDGEPIDWKAARQQYAKEGLPECPLVRTPEDFNMSADATPDDFRDRKDEIRALMLKHGCLWFKGFDLLKTAAGFRMFHEAIELDPCLDPLHTSGLRKFASEGDALYEEVNKPALRQHYIGLHNESTTRKTAAYGAFVCFQPATEGGGEFFIADGKRILRDIDQGVLQRLIDRQFRISVSNLNMPFLSALPGPLQSAAEKQIGSLVQTAVAPKFDMDLDMEWGADGTKHRLQAVEHAETPIIRHPVTGDPVWFCNIQNHSRYMRDNRPCTVPEVGMTETFYGDLSKISEADLDEIDRVSRDAYVACKMERGDVLLCDNYRVSHGRDIFKGDRYHAVTWFTWPGQGGNAGSSMANSKQGDGVNNAMNKYIDALGSLRGD